MGKRNAEYFLVISGKNNKNLAFGTPECKCFSAEMPIEIGWVVVDTRNLRDGSGASKNGKTAVSMLNLRDNNVVDGIDNTVVLAQKCAAATMAF